MLLTDRARCGKICSDKGKEIKTMTTIYKVHNDYTNEILFETTRLIDALDFCDEAIKAYKHLMLIEHMGKKQSLYKSYWNWSKC